ARDRDVIRDRLEGLGRVPDRAFDSGRRNRRLDPTAEVDVVDHLRPGKLPWIAEGQPLFGVLLLPTVSDDLAKESVIVANAVAVGGNSEGGHALHKTSGEPTKAAIAQCRVRLSSSQAVQIDAQIPERRPKHLGPTQIAEDIGKKSPDEELQRQIVDAL